MYNFEKTDVSLAWLANLELNGLSRFYPLFCSDLSGINGLALVYTWISLGLSTPGDSLLCIYHRKADYIQ